MYIISHLPHQEEKDDNGFLLPALVSSYKTKEWWKNGKRHRTEKNKNGLILPALISILGQCEQWRNGKKYKSDKISICTIEQSIPSLFYKQQIDFYFN